MADFKEIKEKFVETTKDVIEDIKEELEEELEEEEKEKTKKNPKDSNNKSSNKKTTLKMVATTVLLFVSCVLLLIASLTIKIKATEKSYNESKDSSEHTAYNKTRQKLYELGERRYHVSNRIGISIDGIEKVSSLEALEVKEIYYYIHEGDKEYKSKAWYKVTGTGTFTVNMKLAEIITDEERNYILIRIPNPTIQSNDLNVKVEEYHFDSNIFEGVDVGEGLALKAEKEGYKEIKKRISADQNYFVYAKNAAEDILVDLAKKCNPDIEVEVEVKFF